MQKITKTVFVSSALLLSSTLFAVPSFAGSGCAFDAETNKGFIATCSEETEEVIITGIVSQQQIEQQLPGYAEEYQQYQADQAIIAKLKNIDKPTDIVVIIGTWCPDCHRETPRFMRILNEVNNPNITVKYIGIDRSKKDPEGLAAEYEFTRIPTFIVHQDDKKIGTIVESPTDSLEGDLYQILAD
ncbi:thioredoxin [Shewanella sp. WXL01]|uniref:Thioredoxin n=1 Tax=Shewanella maritima TaxID=2520507 RepID=A0A411PJL1_9GAMM|nr:MULTISPECIES: thioredoxin family protein [Shewanella]NKF51259.1 thioredoxin [Shewanella sp. WXL01]QBF83570.1 thioredoxin [Shewanella maritima]